MACSGLLVTNWSRSTRSGAGGRGALKWAGSGQATLICQRHHASARSDYHPGVGHAHSAKSNPAAMYLTLAAVCSSSRTEHGQFNHTAQSKMVRHRSAFRSQMQPWSCKNRSRTQFTRLKHFSFTTQESALPTFTSASNAHAWQPV